MEENPNVEAADNQAPVENLAPLEPVVHGQICEHCSTLRTSAWIIGLCTIVAAMILSGSLIYSARMFSGKGSVLGAQTTQSQGPNIPSDVPYLGNPNAKVTVVEYADYQCPFCEAFYKTVWPELKSKYVDTGKIKFVYQDFAFLGADSATAANAAQCAAEQNKFWPYHDYLFDHQGTENTGWATADHLKEFASTVGLNANQFNQCLDANKYSSVVSAEMAEARSLGVSGTPTIYINGTQIVGAQSAATFEQAIDKALQQS